MTRHLMSLAGVAELLNVPPWTVERWVRQGLLHGSPTASGLGFDRVQIERWARRHGISVATRKQSTAQPPEDMLADALDRGALTLAPELGTASDAIALAVHAVPELGADAKETLLREVQDRERLATTALGKGVALPHPRRPPASLIDKPIASLVRLAEPLDWAALDGELVDVVLLVASPTVAEHLEVLARIAFALRVPEFARTLREAESRHEISTRLREIRMSTS